MILQLLSWRVRNMVMQPWKVTERSTVTKKWQVILRTFGKKHAKVILWVKSDKAQELLIPMKCNYPETVFSILMLYLAEKLQIHMRLDFWLLAARRRLSMFQSSALWCDSQQHCVIWSKGGIPLRSYYDCYWNIMIHQEKHFWDWHKKDRNAFLQFKLSNDTCQGGLFAWTF